jgi:hypothetical protein
MKNLILLFLASLLLLSFKQAPTEHQKIKVAEPKGIENIVYKWGQIALQATANDTEKFKPRPTITSRYLALIFVSVFDAWSRYDSKAIPVYLSGVERQELNEQNLKNKEIAISYAAFRTMNEYYFSDKELFANNRSKKR